MALIYIKPKYVFLMAIKPIYISASNAQMFMVDEK